MLIYLRISTKLIVFLTRLISNVRSIEIIILWICVNFLCHKQNQTNYPSNLNCYKNEMMTLLFFAVFSKKTFGLVSWRWKPGLIICWWKGNLQFQKLFLWFKILTNQCVPHTIAWPLLFAGERVIYNFQASRQC